jgi:branched-chain amino acid transport system permease protein
MKSHWTKHITDRKAISVFAVLLALFPLVIRDTYLLSVVILCLVYSILSLSWNFICGFAGIFTLGHQGFFGVGAYVSALLVMRMGISPWLGLLFGACAAAIAGILIGLPCLRLRGGAYIALTTLAFAEIARVICTNLVGLTRGEMGLWGIPPLTDLKIGSLAIQFSGSNRVPYYYLILALFLITVLFFLQQIRSATGLALTSIRESQDASESLGIHVTRYKIYAFVVSAFFAGITGAFYAHYILILTPTSSFSAWMMVDIVAITLIGGLGTLSGPIAAAFILTIGLELLRTFGDYRFIVYGLLLVIIILFVPDGLIRRIFPNRVSDGSPMRDEALLSRSVTARFGKKRKGNAI